MALSFCGRNGHCGVVYAAMAAFIAIAGVVVTLAGTLDLAFNIDGNARLHAALKHQIYSLLALAEDDELSLPELREQTALSMPMSRRACTQSTRLPIMVRCWPSTDRKGTCLRSMAGNVSGETGTRFRRQNLRLFEEVEHERRAKAQST